MAIQPLFVLLYAGLPGTANYPASTLGMWVLIIVIGIIGHLVHARLEKVFAKYSKVEFPGGLTGAEVAEKMLREVPDTVPEYDEARRMLKFLDNFIPIAPDEIPPTSILREFIGGSSFQY